MNEYIHMSSSHQKWERATLFFWNFETTCLKEEAREEAAVIPECPIKTERRDTALGCTPLRSRGRWPWGRMMGCSCKRLGVWKPLRSAGGSRSTVGNQCNWWGPRAHSPLLFLYSLLRWSNSTTWLHIILCKAKLIFTTLVLLRGSPQLMVPLSFQVLRPKLLCCPWYLSFAYMYTWSVDQPCWLYLQNIFGILPIQHPGSSTILGLDFQSRLFTGLCLSSLATLMYVQAQMPLWLH